jgi:hypothetical protein
MSSKQAVKISRAKSKLLIREKSYSGHVSGYFNSEIGVYAVSV